MHAMTIWFQSGRSNMDGDKTMDRDQRGEVRSTFADIRVDVGLHTRQQGTASNNQHQGSETNETLNLGPWRGLGTWWSHIGRLP